MNEKKDNSPHRASPSEPALAIGLGSAICCLTVWLLLPHSALTLFVGLLVSALLGFAVVAWQQVRQRPTTWLEIPFRLAHDADVFAHYRKLSESLLAISQWRDPIYRELALEDLDELIARTQNVARGALTFEGTEAWRIVYERLLRSPGLHLYRSVAWVKHPDYWQDEPGRKSMAVNFELKDAERVTVERIAIIADELWPADEDWPTEPVRQWLHEQQTHGIGVKFVRESALLGEQELIADLGIYGSRAIGIQELDRQCRTVRFRLSFDLAEVAAAEDRWNRLAVYAESFADYLDRYRVHV